MSNAYTASGSEGPPTKVLSNSGVLLVEDVAATVIHGRDASPPGDLIGSYIWAGDVDDDGFDDIGLACTIDGSSRGIEIIHGSTGGLPDVIDLDNTSVPFRIDYPARQIDIGDFDHDGNKDLLMSSQLSGRVYFGNKGEISENYTLLSSGIHQQTWEYPYSDFIWVGDLDGDGLDDFITGTFGCGAYLTLGIWQPDELNIYWSRSGNLTTFTADKWDDFSSSIGVGDIDGDGLLDMAVGVPKADPQEGTSRMFGAVCVYFNLTRFDNATTYHPYEVADSIIYGSDTFDQFGWNVIVQDINGDGKDDILAGAPNSAGVQNQNPGCGEILLYLGKDNRSFPSSMDAENDADAIMIGASGRTTDPDYSGDKIGRTFQLADMDGNGETEILISTPYRSLEPLGGTSRDDTGSLSMYELAKIIPKTGKIVTLGYPAKGFNIEGRDMGDTLGWQIRVGDINGDGLDDLIIGVPGADGVQNLRRNSGEIYIIHGEGIRLMEQRISGPGSLTPKVFAMGGTFDVNLSFQSTKGYDQVTGGSLTIGTGPDAVSLLCRRGNFMMGSDTYGSVMLHPEGCKLGGNGRQGWLTFRLELSWHFPFEGPVDVRFDLIDIDDQNITRSYPSSMVVCKDIRITDTLKVFAGSDELLMKGSYLAPGTTVSLGGAVMVYDDEPLKEVPFQTLRIDHFQGPAFIENVVYSAGWKVEFETQKNGEMEHSLMPGIDPATYPQDLPLRYLPDLGNPVGYKVQVDDTPPIRPTGLRAVSREGNQDNLSRTGEFTLSWDDIDLVEGDRNLSGIREHYITVDDGEPVLALERGGLVGTYFSDLDSYVREKELIDERLHFTVNEWGSFGPDPNLMLPTDYSIRWSGWLDMGDADNVFFKVLGSGDAKLYLDDERVFDWTSVKKGVVIGGYDLKEGDNPRIEIVFRHRSGDSFFSLLYQDDSGAFSPVPSTSLMHPSNSQNIRIMSDTGSVSVHSIDRVGHASESARLDLYRDLLGPVFDLSGVPLWVNTTHPVFEICVRDADQGSFPNSGLDPSSIMFRTVDEEGVRSDWSLPSKVKESVDDPGSYIASIGPELTTNWKGRVQFQASDIEANNVLSPWVEMGVDMRPPDIMVMEPASGETVEGSIVKFMVRATDLGGSGFDGRTLEYRSRSDVVGWSSWTNIGTGSEGTELLFNISLDLEFGIVELLFRGSDLMGNRYETSPSRLTVTKPVINLRPVAVIRTPLNNSVYRYGEPVTLSSEGTHDDGIGEYSPVRMTWTSSLQGLLGTGRLLSIDLQSGEHLITLYADDGAPGHNVSVSVVITILEPPDPNGTGPVPVDEDEKSWNAFVIIFFGMVTVVLMGIVTMVMVARRRQGGETRLGVVKETEDDILLREEGPEDQDLTEPL
ncbi:MAG: FG-GAP repeat protein [Candidatus Thermoplasmatota archaeon]|nr:FG-GAP repeat protein [Candidatus Thermoplasmatota archaeon]